MVLKQGLSLAAAGLVIGLLVALALTRLMQGLLYGVGPADPITFVTVAAVLMLVALAPSLLPAWRATWIPPTLAITGR